MTEQEIESKVKKGNTSNEVRNITNMTHHQRLYEIIELLIEGISRPNIVKRLSKEWNYEESSIRTMIKEAIVLLDEMSPSDKNDIKTMSVARLEELYEKSTSPRDRLRILDLLNKICGTYETNLNVQTENEQIIKFDLGV